MNKVHNHMFKKWIGMCGLMVLVHSAQAQFTFPVYEPFSEYPNNESLGTSGSSGNFWEVGNSPSTSQVITNTAALSYVGLAPDTAATPLGLRGPSGVGRTREATFTAQTSGTVYASVLLNLQSYPSANRAIFGLTSANSGTPNPGTGSVGVWVNAAGQLLISKNNQTTPATNTTVPLPLNTTHLVVISYTFVAGATTNDVIRLWLDPFQLGNNANIPAPALINTNYNGAGADSTTIQGVVLYAPSSTPTMQTYYDEIRVDNNWAGVTPSGPSPGPIFGVTLTGSGTGCPGDAFPIGVSGSVSTDVYFLYTNAVYSAQAVTGTGSAITFGPQSTTAIYTVVASNINTGAVGWMSNSVAISVLAPPDITTQPLPVTVATNGSAVFSVVSSGTGLDYQWYKNGAGLANGGHVSGATTPTLTIAPATTADQASATTGYYVIITNQCGYSAISATNALTLDAPANLVWQGGNPNTNWDLATTPNWTNSAGNFVVFNSGDNVTFDDSSTNPLVTLVGNLAPTTVNEVANQNYTFNGSGSIAGSASLIMSGTGTLAISNADSYTGNTIINVNGTIAVKDPNQMALGYGLVDLAGGTLWFPAKSGSATVGLTNNINVTADSTLQFDGAGSYGLVLFGVISNSSGATLTITHNLNNSAAADRIRLYGNFTNNIPIVVTTAGNTVELAPYNSAGYQVYNGVISGTGGHIAPHDGGNVIFNAANTINDSGVANNGNGPAGYSLLYGGGNVGIGADSVSSSPPTIDSSPVGTANVGLDTTAGNDSMFASGGAHTIANPFVYTSATNTVNFTVNGSNNLTLSGIFSLCGADGSGGTNRTFVINNTALTTFSGVVTDSNLVCGIIKSGAGTLALTAVNTYTGPTLLGGGPLWINGQIDVGGVTVTNGTLGGTGIILGAVVINSPGSIAPGTTALGTLTINNNFSLGGNGLFKLNKSLTPSNDVLSVSGTLANTGTGTITVTNLGPAIVAGDKFTLFSQPVANGAALTVNGAGWNWTNRLALDGSIQALSVAPTTIVPTIPPGITNFSLAAGNVLISGTNGQAGATYYLLTTTNLATPRPQWRTVATNVLGASNYTFIGTNAVHSNSLAQFYTLSSTNYNP